MTWNKTLTEIKKEIQMKKRMAQSTAIIDLSWNMTLEDIKREIQMKKKQRAINFLREIGFDLNLLEPIQRIERPRGPRRTARMSVNPRMWGRMITGNGASRSECNN